MPPPNTPSGSRNVSDDLVPVVFDLYGAQAPPNTPASSHTTSRALREHRFASLNHQVANILDADPPSASDVSHSIDFRGLTYIGIVDENLICPICRVALVDPVDTDCNHTFCRECIAQALAHNEICPIDRSSLSRGAPLKRSHKIVIHQLDALLVRCICCEAGIPRSMLQNHVEKYCTDALVDCPSQTCEKAVKRKLSHKGCLHYDVTCPDCKEIHQELDIGDHRELSCTQRKKGCEHCEATILRCRELEHLEECPDILAPCKWTEYGCQYVSKRKDLYLHTDTCNFKLVGPMAEMMRKEISGLRCEVRALSEKNQGQERRIKFLESGLKESDRHVDYAELSAPIQLPEGANPEPLDSPNEYLLSLIESQESRISQLSAGMTELEAKQTMMLFNETIPIKNELAEMRSSQQVVSMHVRWLLNFRRQENQKRFGAGSGGGVGGGGPGPSGGSDAGGSGGDSPLPRRLSDSMRDLITKL
jgi:TNF receptor-associated factor 5